MADLGGYFAVSYIAQKVFGNAVDALWRTDWEEASGPAHWGADSAFGQLEADGGFSIEKPGFSFVEATNSVWVGVVAAGRFDVTIAGLPAGGVFMSIRAEASLPVRVSQDHAFDKADVDLTGFTVDAANVQLTWYDGPFNDHAPEVMTGPEVRALVADEIRKRAARYLSFKLPTDRVWAAELNVMTRGLPGSVILTPQIQLGEVRILNGWFALGIDATSGIGQTHGNPAGIGPPPPPPPQVAAPMPQTGPGDASLRLLIDPNVFRTYLDANARLAVRFAIAQRPNLHPDFDGIHVDVADDALTIRANGTVDAPDPFPGRMPFDASVNVRPFIPGGTVYASIKPDVHVDAPWYLDVLGAIVDFFGGDAFAALNRANKSQMAILFGIQWKGPIPGIDGLNGRVAGGQIVLRPNLVGVYGEIALTTYWSGPDPAKPTVRDGIGIRERFLQLTPTDRRLNDDPTYRIRYSVKRGSNGEELVSGETWSGSSAPFGDVIDLWDPTHVQETSYTADVTIERPPGTEVGSMSQPIRVVDPFDRSHPYVRWSKQHYFTGGGDTPIPIASAIHRTAIPGRCKFGDFRNSRFGTPYFYDALDSLPAPEDAVLSSRLCGFCFPDGMPDE